MTEAEAAYAKKLGDLLTEAKDKAGLTFDDLAAMTGLSRPHVTRILYGTIDARVADLRRLAKPLQVDVHDLLEKASK